MSRKSREPVWILNGEFIAERRKQSGKPLHQATRILRTHQHILRKLELGSPQNNLDVPFIADLAQMLGVSVAQMLLDYVPAKPEAGADVHIGDARAVGALLAGAAGWVFVDDIADVLGWTLERTDLALNAVEGALEATGQRLAWMSDREVRIVGDADLMPEARELIQREVRAGGLTREEARKLRDIVWGGERCRHEEKLKGIRRLVDTGLLESVGDRSVDVCLSEAGRFALGLDDPVDDWPWPPDGSKASTAAAKRALVPAPEDGDDAAS